MSVSQPATIPVSDDQKGVLGSRVMIRDGMGQEQVTVVTADATKEYVSSTLNVWGAYIQGIRALPQSIDDITRDLGVDIYERMGYDPEVSSLVNLLKAATLSQMIDLGPAIQDESDPEYTLSTEIHDHFERVFRGLKPSFSIIADNLLDALFQGNKVAEKVYSEGSGQDAGKYVLTKLSVKHRSVLFFIVNRFGDIAGFIPALVGGGINGASAIGISLLDTNAKDLIPRDKFAVLAFRPKDGDPRGTSILRSIYNAWWLKMQIWPELLKYLAQFGGPSIIGFTSPDSRDVPVTGSDGQITMMSPEQIMLPQLEAWRNGAAAAFPTGSLVQIIQAVGNGEAFLKSIELLDRQISKGVTGQELATGEGQHQARSASEVHQDILELLITYIKQVLCDMIVSDIMEPAVSFNWGPQYLHLTPTASLGEVRKQDKAALMTAYIAGGYSVDESQWVGIDQELHVPSRDPESIQQAIDARQAAQEAALKPPEPPSNSKPANQAT